MAIIYSYPTVIPTANDLVLGTDVDNTGKATRNFTVQSIIDLVTVTGNNLQDVLNNGNIAVGRDIILGTVQDPTQTIYANTFSTGVASIIGGVGQNFTDFTSTRITGTLQTAVQPNVTSVGTLVSLKVGTATPAITSIVTTFASPGTNLAIPTTEAIVDYINTKPAPSRETLAETLVSGNTTGGTNIAVSAGDDVTFTDTSKIIMGAGGDFEIYHGSFGGSDQSWIRDLGTNDLILDTNGTQIALISDGVINNGKMGLFKKDGAVELYYDNNLKFETLLNGAKVSGAFEATGVGTLNGIVNTNSYTDSSGDTGTSGQILSSTGASGTNWITDPNPTPYSWLVEADSGTGSPYTVANGNQIHFKGDTNISTSWDNTNKEVLISLSGTSITGSGAANQVTYWDGAQTITGAAGLTFAGGANGKVAIAGELEVSGVLTDGTFTGQVGAYTGFASIASTVFVGPLQGNADTATALAAAGAVSMSGDAVASGVTYTSGGNVPLVSTISDSVVYNKELAGFNETNGAVANGDSILEALEKLQGQITNLPQGIVYQGIWDPGTSATSGGTPDLRLAANKVNGHYYIVSTAGIGTPNGNGTTPNDWDVRDWCVFADDGAGGGADEWQKIDNSSLAGGTGTANTMTKWLTNQTIGNSTITDNGSIVTIADTIDFTTQGNNTFGNTSADTTLMKGNTTLEQNLILAKGLSLGSSYGSAGQVLTSGGGINVANTWTSPTVGTVTTVSATTAGDALDVAVTNPTTTPAIALTWAGAASQYVNGLGNLITFPTADNYVSWTADSDEGTDIAVTSGFNLKFTGAVTSGGAGIATDSAVSANEMTIGLINAGGTPSATSFYRGDGQWAVPVGTKTETLAEVLSNGNTTGSNIISVTNANINFQDSTAVGNGRARFGTGNDLQIYHDSINSYIQDVGTGDLYIDASNNFFVRNQANGEVWIKATDGGVSLRYQDSQKLITTSTGISVTGDGVFTGAISAGGTITCNNVGSDKKIAFRRTGGNNFSIEHDSAFIYFYNETTSNVIFKMANNNDTTFTGNVKIDGNLTVDGHIIHGGGGGGTGKGGQFTKLFTSVSAGSTAFTIDRATTGTMVFDVMFTSDTSIDTSIAKKYTVIATYGPNAPLYNKILDSGPDANNADFTVAFADDTSNTKIKCTITPVTIATQKIGITIDLGFGQNNATVVMNA